MFHVIFKNFFELLFLSFLGGGGVGVLDIDLPIFSPEQALKPVHLLRKATQGTR